MDTQKYVGILVGLLVSGLILATFTSVISSTVDSVEGYAVYENPGDIAPYTEMKVGDHLYWSPTGITLNNEVIEGDRVRENWFKGETFLGADNMFFALKSDNTLAQVSGLLYVDITVNDDLSITYVYENQDTGGVAQTRKSAPMSWGFLIANKGDWCQVKYDSPETTVYFNSLDDVYTSGPAGGLTSSVGTTAYHLGSEYDDGIVFHNVVDLNNGVYSLNFDIGSLTYNVPGISDDIRVIVVPLTVESERTPNVLADIIEIIPLIAGIGLLMFALGIIIYRRV